MRCAINVKWRRRGFVAIFLMPTLICFSIFYIYPLVTVFVTSLMRWDYRNIQSPAFFAPGELFTNYSYIFNRYPYFKEALRNSLIWAGVGLLVQTPLALTAALAFSRKLPGWKFARNVYIIPNIISSAAIALIFLQLYNPRYGVINPIIRLFSPGFSENILLISGVNIIAMTCGYVFFAGTGAIMILGHIMAIPEEIRDAAKIDGASGFRMDVKIIIPSIKPILKTVAVLAVTSGFLLYNEVYFLTKGAAGSRSMSYVIRDLAVMSTRTQFARANAVGVIQIISGMLLMLCVNLLFTVDIKALIRRRRGF